MTSPSLNYRFEDAVLDRAQVETIWLAEWQTASGRITSDTVDNCPCVKDRQVTFSYRYLVSGMLVVQAVLE